MSRTHHARPTRTSDAASRVRNAAAAVADAMKRLDRDASRFRDVLAAARAAGLDEAQIIGAVRVACAGRPDRTRALEELAGVTREARG